MKNSKLVLALLFISVSFYSCKKNDKETKSKESEYFVNSRTLTFTNPQDAAGRYRKVLNNISNRTNDACAGDAYTNMYSITSGCSGTTLNLTEVIFLEPTKPASASVEINGHAYSLTYVSQYSMGMWKYTLSGVSLSAIGISNYCSASSISMEYFACGEATPYTETLPINEGVACGSGSYNCYAYSSSAGTLTMGYPTLGCGCSNNDPTQYKIRYKKGTSGSWTEITLNPSSYSTPQTVTGLPSGDYYVESQNVCYTNESGPWVPNGSSGGSAITVN